MWVLPSLTVLHDEDSDHPDRQWHAEDVASDVLTVVTGKLSAAGFSLTESYTSISSDDENYTASLVLRSDQDGFTDACVQIAESSDELRDGIDAY